MKKEVTMNCPPSTATAHALREELSTSRIPFKDGDVIKFTAYGQHRYVAIRADEEWYFAGERDIYSQGASDSTMIEILKDDKQDIVYIAAGVGEVIV